MSTASNTTAALKRTPVIVAIVVAVLVLVIWLLAFFLPQGHKLSTLDAKEQALQQQVTAGNAKVAKLKRTFQHVGQLEVEQGKFESYVPSTTDLFKTTANYTSSLSAAVSAAGMTLTSVTPGAAHAQTSTGTSLTKIPVVLAAKGPYDGLLTLIKSIYTLPRLTDINSVTVRGGGPGTNRSTTLDVTLNLVIFTTAKPPTP